MEEKIESLVSLLGAHAGVLNKPDLPRHISESSTRVDNIEQSPQEISYGSSSMVIGQRGTYRPQDPPTWAPHIASSRNAFSPMMQDPVHVPIKVQQNPPTPSLSGASIRSSATRDLSELSIPSGDEADQFLKSFREKYAVQLPFLVVPPDIDAQDLHDNRPWLYRAVMLVCNDRNMVQQLLASERLSLDLVEGMILRGEKSLDMLQVGTTK